MNVMYIYAQINLGSVVRILRYIYIEGERERDLAPENYPM